ncbi:hypothetical protein DFH07DRAFT_467109 [Mycena maculata]|uniref:MYND-type domain-containing protein n=1 Tax=Mycena maculata TaxID=230809 RepID=A0AAD7K819_9AGAR|nr:hypothetical protein DFH07DRAFT_467109 [Mycena maculata]
MNPSPINHPCLVCGRATSRWCGRCQTAWYCSDEHSRGDWPRHREQCRPSQAALGYGSNIIATPPPAEPECISVSGILFVADEDRPRIITVKCRPPYRPSHGPCPAPLLQPYFDAPPESVVLTQGLNGEPLRFPLHIFYSPIALAKGSPINRSIYHITSGAAPKPWYGNVVALKFNGARRQGYTEAGANDLPALSAYFLSYQ